nr:MAG TPA: hypothetical protein [Caudoviricetes sp.]
MNQGTFSGIIVKVLSDVLTSFWRRTLFKGIT